MTDFIEVYEDALPLDMCNAVINLIDNIAKSNPSGLINGAEQYAAKLLRKDVSVILEEHDPVMAADLNGFLDKALSDYIQKYPELHLLGTDIYSDCCKIQKTPPGGGFTHWHCEASDARSSRRQLVWMVYLNTLDLEDGGETEFRSQVKRLNPKAGTIVLFPAFWTHGHKGNPPYNKDKYIATGWYNMEVK
jgi:hypothetical protein